MQQFIKFYYSIFICSSTCFGATHRPSSGAQNCTGSLWFFMRGRLSGTLCLTTSTSYTSNNLPRMKNQRLLVQFWAPGDGRCVARNMSSFI